MRLPTPMAKDLSILIPARNEMFLAKTIECILNSIRADTEIIVVLDGEWPNPPLIQHERLKVLFNPVSVGQRAATNQAARLSHAKYVMKVDAHCSFDEGFDAKMIAEMKDDYTMVPTMYNLHVFDWVCIGQSTPPSNDLYFEPIPEELKKQGCGHRLYQGPTPDKCPKCGGKMIRELTYIAKPSPRSNFYRFDKTLHFQYWKEFEKRLESKGDIAETMSIQGSCFMLTRKKYWELNICDEKHGSWGQQGVEVACKTWLSGGRLVVNKKTWYSHLFRTQGGDFGFPYPNPGITKAREYSRDLWLNNKWDKAIHPLSWLINKFAPVPDWDITKGGLYYSDCQLDEKIMKRCQDQIKKDIGSRIRIVSVTLKPIDFGDNIYLPLERGYLTMAKQILAGLKELDTDVVFFCEHDVLYHKSHFNFIPPTSDRYYYNTNVYRVRFDDGLAIRVDDCRQLSGICADRNLLITHYEKRVKLLEDFSATHTGDEFKKYVRDMGFEPGTHNRAAKVDDIKSDRWESEFPNIDIRHGTNLTDSRWKKEQFRNEKYTRGWIETFEIPGWGYFGEVIENA